MKKALNYTIYKLIIIVLNTSFYMCKSIFIILNTYNNFYIILILKKQNILKRLHIINDKTFFLNRFIGGYIVTKGVFL